MLAGVVVLIGDGMVIFFAVERRRYLYIYIMRLVISTLSSGGEGC